MVFIICRYIWCRFYKVYFQSYANSEKSNVRFLCKFDISYMNVYDEAITDLKKKEIAAFEDYSDFVNG